MDDKSNLNLVALIGLAALAFLLAAAGLYLLRNPQARLPWVVDSPTAESARPTLSPTGTPQPTDTRIYIPSYTPFVTRLPTEPLPTTPVAYPPPALETPTSLASPVLSQTASADTPGPSLTLTSTATNTPALTPSITPTLEPGQFGISGRVVQNGTPLSGVTVSFIDDQPSRSAVTAADGQYWFTTLAIGASFTLSFNLDENLQLSPSAQLASTAFLQGFLPGSSPVINLPDLEISLLLDGHSFEPLSPLDGAGFDRDVIAPPNPIQFTWTTYNFADYYFVELRTSEKDEVLWTSPRTTSTNVMFDGELDDGTHIPADTYAWFVIASRPAGIYRLTVYTLPREMVITP
jgi:hypothetical protein